MPSQWSLNNLTENNRPIPFWFWNDRLDKQELGRQLAEMKLAGVSEFFIHARQGLLTPYLSEEWFDCVTYTLQKAKELGMKAWLYDEDNWPSGYAGGKLLERNPEYRAKHLARVSCPVTGGRPVHLEVPDGKLVAVLATGEKSSDAIQITTSVQNNQLIWDVPPGQWNIHFFLQRWTSWNPAYSEGFYIDLLDPEAVSCFIDLTHEEYRKRYPEELGTVIRGIFTDEPGFYNNLWGKDPDTVPWTTSFLSVFEQIKGYDLTPYLFMLWEGDTPDAARVRLDFYHVVSLLFRDSFFKPIYQWCEQYGMQSLGHVTIEEELKYHPRMFGSFFHAMEYLHIPGIDQISQTDFQSIAPKLGSSSAHAHGRPSCFSETFGVYGWKLTLEEMKRTTDWLYSQGINLMVPHAFYYSIRDERRQECPPSEFFQNSFWPFFSVYADYVSRLGSLLHQGRHQAEIAVYYPITSVWAEIFPSDSTEVDLLDHSFKWISNWLTSHQKDFDYLDDDSLQRSEITSGEIALHDERYRLLILPAARFIPDATLEYLLRFCKAGGSILAFRVPDALMPEQNDLIHELFYESFPGKLNSVGNGRVILLNENDEAFNSALKELIPIPDIELEPHCPEVSVLVRIAQNSKLYFISNRSSESQHFRAKFRAQGDAFIWDPETGESFRAETEAVDNSRQMLSLTLPGYGSLAVVFGQAVNSDRSHLALRMASLDPKPKLEIKGDWEISFPQKPAQKLESLQSWSDLGYPDYSGNASYSIQFNWDMAETGWAAWLDLGEVHEIAHVWLNGEDLGVRVWRPYGFNITGRLKSGMNLLKLQVINTPANKFREQVIRSGLLGPVTICILECPSQLS